MGRRDFRSRPAGLGHRCQSDEPEHRQQYALVFPGDAAEQRLEFSGRYARIVVRGTTIGGQRSDEATSRDFPHGEEP